jgi:hypothetical protein
VFDLGEGLEGFVSNPLGGGVRGHPFRVLLFQFQQSLEEPVIGGIRYLRVIQDIIPMIVISDLLPKIVQFFLVVHGPGFLQAIQKGTAFERGSHSLDIYFKI